MSNLNMSNAEQATATLEARCGLSRTTEWEKAALVALLVGPPGRPGTYTTHELAALGFTGMKTEQTVRRYRDAWFMVRGDVPRFGEPIELPTEDFPEAPETIRKRQKKEAEAARAAVALQASVTEVARYHGVTPNEVRTDEALMRVAEFVDVRSREAAKVFRSSVDEEARRMLPALYAEAGDGDVVAENRRARYADEREWETRVLGVERQWQQVDDLLARAEEQLNAAITRINWLADPSHPRMEGSETVRDRLPTFKEAIWTIEALIRSASAGDSVA